MHRYSQWKFTILSVSLLLFLTARVAISSGEEQQLIVDICGAALILAAALSISDRHRVRQAIIVAGSIVIALMVASGGTAKHANRLFFIPFRVAAALFLGLTVFGIIRKLLTQPGVTRDSLAGAFCGYVLIGIAWTQLYCCVALLDPTAFGGLLSAPEVAGDYHYRARVLEYFSFVTLTSMGYGDIVPTSPVARMLACFEVVCGQFYLAVLVAGLVGMRAALLLAEAAEARLARIVAANSTPVDAGPSPDALPEDQHAGSGPPTEPGSGTGGSGRHAPRSNR